MEKKVKKQKRKSIGAKYRDKAFANEFVKN
jgi:hypothetical protein